MPVSLELRVKNFVVKYGPAQMPEGGYVVKYEDVETCIKLQLEASTTKEFLKACAVLGISAAVIGVTLYFLKDYMQIPAWIIGFNCVIFQVAIPAEKEDVFDRYVANELREELNQLFSAVENHLRKELGDDVDGIDEKVLGTLKATRISSVAICDDEAVKQAKKKTSLNRPVAEHVERTKAFGEVPPPPPPRKLKVRENPRSPSTSIIVFYQPLYQRIVDKYVVVAESLDGKRIEKETNKKIALVGDLEPGQWYLVSVQSVRDGVRSEEVQLEDLVRTAMFDPRPWRAWDATSSAADHGASGSGDSHALCEIGNQEESDTLGGDLDLWKSDLHMELRKILRVQFPDSKMKRLLFKCNELGIVEAKDLKFLESKDISDELKGTIKPVEILKLMDYAKDLYATPFGTSEEDTKDGNVYNIQNSESFHISDFH